MPDIFDNGFEAYQNGLDIIDNPYLWINSPLVNLDENQDSSDVIRIQEWRKGWMKAYKNKIPRNPIIEIFKNKK